MYMQLKTDVQVVRRARRGGDPTSQPYSTRVWGRRLVIMTTALYAFSTKEYCERSFSKYDPAVNSRRAVNSAKFVFKYV